MQDFLCAEFKITAGGFFSLNSQLIMAVSFIIITVEILKLT